VKVLSAVFIAALLFSAVALFQFVSLASANPYDGIPVPPAFQMPNEDPPTVTIQSPLNTTIYFENDVLLNFTVTKPASWFKPDVVCYIKNITYQMDGGQAVVLYTPTPPTPPSELPGTEQFSVVLDGLPEGQHTLQIKVSAESQYLPNDTYYWFMVRHYPLRVSQTIVFTVDNSPTPTPTPEHSLSVDPNFSFYTGLALLITAFVAFAGLMVYFKKRKH
jgi:hypothetical protein